jgi:hypothetical protein
MRKHCRVKAIGAVQKRVHFHIYSESDMAGIQVTALRVCICTSYRAYCVTRVAFHTHTDTKWILQTSACVYFVIILFGEVDG